MAALETAAVAKLLVELSRRTALAGNNYFRSRAYLRAADSLAALAEPLDRTIGDNRLRQVPRIGDTIADIVIKLHRTGTHPLLEKLRCQVPEEIVEILDARGASFVSVTQQFNTTTSMGRLTLNILLSFAQFEREVIGERIRDKIAASKMKGMWMGGVPPLGYRVRDRKLVIVDGEAEIVRSIFRRYAQLGSVRLLRDALEARGVKSKSWTSASGRLIGGKSFSRGAHYLMLQNRLYRGEIVHKGQSHPGEHTPIIDQPMWDTVQEQLAANTAARNSGTRTRQPSLLAGMLFDDDGNRMTPSHAVKQGARYRYYVSHRLITKDQTERSAGQRIPAGEIEHLVTGRVRQWLLDSGSIYQATRLSDPSTQRRLIARAAEIGKSWTELPGTRQRSFLPRGRCPTGVR